MQDFDFSVSGYAALWLDPADRRGTEYPLGDGRYERFAPTAFDRTLSRGRNVSCDLSHSGNLFLGCTEQGTLRLWTDELGLRYSLDLSRCPMVRTVIQLVQCRAVRGASVGFYGRESNTFWDDGREVIEWTDVDLKSFGLVNLPAYRGTTCELIYR